MWPRLPALSRGGCATRPRLEWPEGSAPGRRVWLSHRFPFPSASPRKLAGVRRPERPVFGEARDIGSSCSRDTHRHLGKADVPRRGPSGCLSPAAEGRRAAGSRCRRRGSGVPSAVLCQRRRPGRRDLRKSPHRRVRRFRLTVAGRSRPPRASPARRAKQRDGQSELTFGARRDTGSLRRFPLRKWTRGRKRSCRDRRLAIPRAPGGRLRASPTEGRAFPRPARGVRPSAPDRECRRAASTAGHRGRGGRRRWDRH